MAPIVVSPSKAAAHAIDKMGFGRFQVMLLVMTGGVMFSEGAEMLVMGSITMLLHDHWELSAFLRGLMVAIVFVGFSVGNLLSGMIGDRWGRRRGILLSYAIIGTCGFFTASAWSPQMMVCFRFLVGVGCGIGFPTIYAFIPEVCPTELRSSICTLMIGFMPIGELYAAILVLCIDPDLKHTSGHCEAGYFPSRNMMKPYECSWRALCEYSAIPAFVFFGLALCFLHESPQFLAVQGRYDELENVLRKMAAMNGATLDLDRLRASFGAATRNNLELQHVGHKYSFRDSVRTLAQPYFRFTTIFMFFAHFTKDFSVFGLSYVLPQYFMFLRSLVTGVQLIIVAALALPGVLFAFCATKVSSVGHIISLITSAGMCACFSVGMLEAIPDWVSAVCAYLTKVFALAYFIITVVYTTEVFPTDIRNTAVGICTCMGRLGSISAPLLFELTLSYSKSFDVFTWSLFVLMTLIALTGPFCLTHEPKGRELVESYRESQPQLTKPSKYGSVA